MSKILGNDISNYQGDINFDIYKQNSNFLIIKASEGIAYTDIKLKRNQLEARRVGLPLGYYHFARPTYGNDAIKEADYFLGAVGQLKEGELLMLDFEETFPDAVNWCKKWLDRVFEKTGVRALIYMDQSRVTGYAWKPLVDAGYGLWIAAYTYNPDNNNFKTGPWTFAAMQQWTSSQKVPGTTGNLDGDVFFGDVATLKRYGYKTTAPVPNPTDWQKLYNDEVVKNKTLSDENLQLKTAASNLQTKIDNAKRDLN